MDVPFISSAADIRHRRKTKIIATLGPASETEEMLQALIRGGVNVFRLNMSHAKHDWVREITARIRAIAEALCVPVGILMDTQGPAIRTGDLDAPIDLKPGDSFTFTQPGQHKGEPFSVDTNYDQLIDDVKIGDRLLVDNGVIHMVVREKIEGKLRCEVITSGKLGNRRHINLPGVKVNLPALTDKDKADIAVGVECGVDYIALSFVRDAPGIRSLRSELERLNAPRIPIIAKIEDQSALRHIRDIVDEADGIMVARGDLGIEVAYEDLPIIQRQIVRRCVTQGKPVIVATHLLESMIQNPVPTRAEVTDVANACFEQADAIMLSGETTVGKYPLEAVQVLQNVARRMENAGELAFHGEIHVEDERSTIITSAIVMANNIKADGIVCFTRNGTTPSVCAALRPRWTPIYCFTPSQAITRKLTLRFGVFGFTMPLNENPEATIENAEAILRDRGLLQKGTKLVVISDIISRGRIVQTVQLRILSDS